MRRLFFLLLLTATGCTLPDVGPFVDASNQLRSAVATSGATVVRELRLMPDGTGQADRLQREWEARNKAFAAIAAYSSSLQAIVASGNQGAASAQKLADSVNSLASAAGIAIPGSPEAVATATDIGKFLYAQIAKARAAKSLRESMGAAQPAIESICSLIAADLKDIEEIFIAASKAADNEVRKEFSDLIGYRDRLMTQIKNSDPTSKATLAEQVQVGQLLQATEGWYSEYVARRKGIADRLRAGRALVQGALQSANDWGIAHGALLTALKERRPVNTDSLVQTAVEIQTLVRKVREL